MTALAASATATPGTTLLRRSADAPLVAVALGLAALPALGARLSATGSLGVAVGTAATVGLAICWASNTISHNHLHNPLFRARALNRLFSLYLSVLLAVPQSFWRARHFWHHAGEPAHKRPRLDARARLEAGLAVAFWGLVALVAPRFFFCAWAPGYLLGLGLCKLQGELEHPDGPGAVSHYGKLYNLIWFNDGHHVEHHAQPRAHWTELPGLRAPDAASALPPLVRAAARLRPVRIKNALLGWLERWVLCSRLLQRFMLATHERAFRPLLGRLGRLERVAVVGGGLFPRTAILLRRLLPAAEVVVVEMSAEHIALARAHLERSEGGAGRIRFVQAVYDPARGIPGADLVVIPLAFDGDRAALERTVGAPLLVHDWIWRPSRESRVVSWLLFKRLSLLRSRP
jgi:hypothetical protein